MSRILAIALVSGLVAGLLVGGFHNIFTVPVLERAIVLEEERAAATETPGAAEAPGGPEVSLGMQRVGMALGTGLIGLVLGMIFSVGFFLLRRVVPQWHPLLISLSVAALAFWAMSLFPFIKYPMVPPGVGDSNTLLMRQWYQTLFFALSGLGMVGLLIAFQWIKDSGAAQKTQRYALALAAYGVFALVIVFAIPGNPDPVPLPIDLLELFRALTMVGQFLHWTLLGAGVGLALTWLQRSDHRSPNFGAGDRSTGASVR